MSNIVNTTRISKAISKIKFNVGIKDPKDLLKPGDIIEGILYLQNVHEKKDLTIKQLDFLFFEHVYIPKDEQGTNFAYIDSIGKIGARTIKHEKTQIGEKLKSGETKEIPFSVKVPGGFHSNLGGQNPSKDWFVGFAIATKSKLFPSYQYNRIIPIQNSDRAANWLD